MKRISDKKRKQKEDEIICYEVIWYRAKGRCEKCGGVGDWRKLHKHEIIPRSKGGDPTDPDNCLLLCGKHHSEEHNIHEVDSKPMWGREKE